MAHDFFKKALTHQKHDEVDEDILSDLLVSLVQLIQVDNPIIFVEQCRKLERIKSTDYIYFSQKEFNHHLKLNAKSEEFKMVLSIMKSLLLGVKTHQYLKNGLLIKAAKELIRLTEPVKQSLSSESGLKATLKENRFSLENTLTMNEKFDVLE